MFYAFKSLKDPRFSYRCISGELHRCVRHTQVAVDDLVRAGAVVSSVNGWTD